jgi:hypothetical protein
MVSMRISFAYKGTPNIWRKRTDIGDSFARGLLDSAPPFIRKQIERLQLHMDDEADIIAWVSRSLMEFFFILRYMYDSRKRYDEVIKEQLKDLNQIEDIINAHGDTSIEHKAAGSLFKQDMKRLWDGMSDYGIERQKLVRPISAKYYADGAGLTNDYDRLWKIHSKYVHPISYVLFGRRNFVYGDEVKKFFLVLAQYYAARNLRDLYKMIEAIPFISDGI